MLCLAHKIPDRLRGSPFHSLGRTNAHRSHHRFAACCRGGRSGILGVSSTNSGRDACSSPTAAQAPEASRLAIGEARLQLQVQGALPRPGQEHRAADDAVCVEQSVDGSAAPPGGAGMSAPAVRRKAAEALENVRLADQIVFIRPTDSTSRKAGSTRNGQRNVLRFASTSRPCQSRLPPLAQNSVGTLAQI